MINDTDGDVYFKLTIANVLICMVGSFLIMAIVLGNLIVIVAVIHDRSLRSQYSNWYIVSLALSDLFVGMLVMPLSLVYEITVTWILGGVLCEAWLALDVLFVTASIINLCAIAIDRFWSVSKPLECRVQRTKVYVIKRIVCVWFLSVMVACPPLLGWRPSRPPKQCDLSADIGYVLYSAMGSFFIPAVILLFVNAKICSHMRHRKQQKQNAQRRKMRVRTPSKSREGYVAAATGEGRLSITKSEMTPHNRPPHENQTLRVSDYGSTANTKSVQERSELNTSCGHPGSITDQSHETTTNGTSRSEPTSHSRPQNGDHILTVSDYGVAVDVKPVQEAKESKSSCSHTPSKTAQSCEMTTNGSVQFIKKSDTKITKSSVKINATQNRLKRKPTVSVPQRDRKLNLVLGIVVLVFMVCWCPFFATYLLPTMGILPPEIVFKIVIWLGYVNSVLNPLIYAMFNVKFRRSFAKLLRLRTQYNIV